MEKLEQTGHDFLHYEAIGMSSTSLIAKFPLGVFIEKLKRKSMAKVLSEIDKGNQREEFLLSLIPIQNKKTNVSFSTDKETENSLWSLPKEQQNNLKNIRSKFQNVQEDAFKWKHRGEYW